LGWNISEYHYNNSGLIDWVQGVRKPDTQKMQSFLHFLWFFICKSISLLPAFLIVALDRMAGIRLAYSFSVMVTNRLLLVCLGSTLAVAGSCAHALPPCSALEPLPLSLRAAEWLNPGENGESLATTVRVYQLRDVGKLATASIEQILDEDRAVLGEDLVSVKEITLYPGETARPLLNRREGALFLAVVAFFRHPSGSAWRVASKLQPPNSMHCHIRNGQDTRQGLRFGLVESRVELRARTGDDDGPQ
jgi:type VI secretion system protein VasD